MGTIVRFIFKTNFRYSKIDSFLILLGFLGIIEWIIILFTFVLK